MKSSKRIIFIIEHGSISVATWCQQCKISDKQWYEACAYHFIIQANTKIFF